MKLSIEFKNPDLKSHQYHKKIQFAYDISHNQDAVSTYPI